MPKYIDADALRKRMEQIAEESKPAATARPMREDTPSELLRYGTARAMIEWLDEIPTADVEPKQRWIPVTERLPEIGEEVLVFAVEKSNDFSSVIAITHRMIFRLFTSSEGVETWSSPWQYFMTNYEITHWKPLPEPPKGEKED